MQSKSFTDKHGVVLIVRQLKHSVVFELAHDEKGHHFDLRFEPDQYKELMAYIDESAQLSWDNLVLRDATSSASDYDEYYDKELDNNGQLAFGNYDNLKISRPMEAHKRMYKFNKRKMETFLFDCTKYGLIPKREYDNTKQH